MRVDYIFYFWLTLFSLFVLIQLTQWIQNSRIKNRYKKFKYFTDYDRFKDLINPKFNKFIFVIANLLLVVSLAFLITFTFIDFQVYQYYYIMFIPILISDATIVYHEYSRKYQKIDLEEADVAYYKIDGIISNTDRYIEERQAVVKELEIYMQTTQKELAPLLGKASSALFSSIIEDLEKKKTTIQGKIDNLQSNIDSLKVGFIETLNLKLKNEKANFNKIFKATSMDSSERDSADEMLEIKVSTEEKIAQAVDSYVSMAQNLPLKEIKIIFQTYAKFNENITATSVISILEKMVLETTEYKAFIDIFYAIPVDVGEVFKHYFIPKDIQWIYTHQFVEKLVPSQKRAVYKELIVQKASQSIQTLLAQLDPVTLSEMDELSHIVKVDPIIIDKIKRYQRITERLYQSFNALNAPENIYLILQQLQYKSSETQDFLNNHPLNSVDLNIYAETIFKLYHQEFQNIAEEVIHIIEMLDSFKAFDENARALFNWDRLENFILENAGRLNLGYVYLGLGLFYIDLEKTNLLTRMNELKEPEQHRFKMLLNKFDSDQNFNFERIKDTGKWDKNILNHPRVYRYKDRLPNIIMRVENQRMTLSNIAI